MCDEAKKQYIRENLEDYCIKVRAINNQRSLIQCLNCINFKPKETKVKKLMEEIIRDSNITCLYGDSNVLRTIEIIKDKVKKSLENANTGSGSCTRLEGLCAAENYLDWLIGD